MTTSLSTSEQGNYVIKPFPFNPFLYPVQGPTGYPLRFLTVCLAIIFWLTSFSVQAEIPSNPCTPPSLTITPNPSLTVGLNASLVLTASGAADGYLWSTFASTAGIIHPTSVTGTTVYSVTGTTAGCQGVASVTVVVANCANIPASSLPSLTITANPSLTVGLNSSLVLTASGSTSNYDWSNFAATASIIHPTSVTGTTVYSVTGTMAGCPVSTSVSVVVANCADIPASSLPSLTITANPSLTVSPNASLNLTASGSTAGYLWSTFANTAAITPATATTGTQVYSVTGTMAGCPVSASVTVVVRVCPVAPVLTTSATTVCEGTNVQIVATVSGNVTSYQWFKDGVLVPGQTSAILSLGGVVPAQAGSYVLVISGCGSFTSNAFTLTVNPLPTVTLTVPQGSTVVGPGTGVATITIPKPLTGFNFQAFGGSQYERFVLIERLNGYEIRQVDTNTTGIFNVTQPGPFRLTVTGANGCQRTVEGVVMIQP
jgi:hypothetical protein